MGGGCFKPSLESVACEPPWMRWRATEVSTEALSSANCPVAKQSLGMTVCTASLVARLESAGATTSALVAHPDSARAATEKLDMVLRAAEQPGALGAEQLAQVIAVLAVYDPAEVVAWLAAWVARKPSPAARARSRAGLLAVMQQVLAQCLDKQVEAAEATISGRASCDFGCAASICEEEIKLTGDEGRAVHPAALWLSCSAGSGTIEGSPSALAYVVPALDRLVLAFRYSLLSDMIGLSWKLHRWREMESECGLPSVERYLPLLGCGAKAVMLAMLTVPSDSAPLVVVVDRGLVPLDRGLPDGSSGCVISPYFKSPAGTKVVQGWRVEGGEGHGPRKEFFISASSGSTSKWAHQRDIAMPPLLQDVDLVARFGMDGSSRVLSLDAEASSGAADIARYASVLGCLETVVAGEQLTMEFADGSQVQTTVVAAAGRGTVAVREILRLPKPAVVRRVRLQTPITPLFEFHRGTGQYWFGSYADELSSAPVNDRLRERYVGFGKLLALAVANHCKISFSLPVIFFGLLLHRGAEVPVLADLRGFDDDLYNSLRTCLKMKSKQLKPVLELEGLPGNMTGEAYVSRRVASTLAPEAMLEVKRGFWSLAGAEELWSQVLAADLRQILCPADAAGAELNIRDTFEVLMDEELVECQHFVNAFWSVVDNFTLAETRRFLFFVTGMENPPEPGTERLHIEVPFYAFTVEEHERLLHTLPQAHTCSNCLEIPNYFEALQMTGHASKEAGPQAVEAELRRLIGEKLRLAINETGGYELDGTDCDLEPLMCTLPKAASPLSGTLAMAGDEGVFGAEDLRPLSAASSHADMVTIPSTVILGDYRVSCTTHASPVLPGSAADRIGAPEYHSANGAHYVGVSAPQKEAAQDQHYLTPTPQSLGVDDLLDELGRAMELGSPRTASPMTLS